MRWLLFSDVHRLTTWGYKRRTPWTGLVELAGALALSLLIGFAAFQRFWLLPSASLQLGLMTAYLLAFSERLTSEERDKARVKTMFKGYVSDSVVDMLLEFGAPAGPAGSVDAHHGAVFRYSLVHDDQREADGP